MADEERDDQFDQDEEREEKLFDHQEAERLLPLLESLISTVVEEKKLVEGIDEEFARVQNRILLYGGLVPPYGYLVQKKLHRDTSASALREALTRMEQTGCIVKDLDRGLIDFLSIVNDEQVYLCWKRGEPSIRYWHRLDEGFAGRKPLGPSQGGRPGLKPN
ncbi:MAG: DUF2203 domain-containing protein [Terriglobia bacterium]